MTNYKRSNKILDLDNGPIISNANCKRLKKNSQPLNSIEFIYDYEAIKHEYI